MAKKKVQAVTAGKTAKKKVVAPAAKEVPKVARKAPAKAPKSEQSLVEESVSAAHAFDSESIGAAAGVVWWALNEHGPQELSKLKKSVDMPADAILAAVGWLAREGKLSFKTNDKTLTIALS